MSSETDQLLHRRRLRRSLGVWRAIAILLAVGAIGALAYVLSDGAIGTRGGNHVARLEISGPILYDRPLLETIRRAREDDAVRGVILAINSPGGSTVGGESLYAALRELAARKPVVAQIDTLGTSAAYMAAIASDHIVAYRTTITGSIGVLIQYGQVERLLDSIGIDVDKVDSGPLKAEPSPFSAPEPDAIAMLQGIVDDSYEWFVGLVAERRGLSAEAARAVADGRILTGHQALEAGLIDEIGGEAAAVAWLEGRGVPANLPVRTWRPRRPSEGGLFFSIADRIADRLIAAIGLAPGLALGDGVAPGWFIAHRLTIGCGAVARADRGGGRVGFGAAWGDGPRMIKSELVQRLAKQNPHLYQRDMENVVNAIFDEIGAALERGDRVELRGFGAFSVRIRPSRVGRNPRTGEQVFVAEKRVPFFKTGKELRERLNNGYAGDDD